MSKPVITILLIFCLQIIASAGTDGYIEKQKKLYETSIVDAEKEWEAAQKAKKAEELFALGKYIKAIECVKAYWTKKEDFDKALVYKKRADEFRVLLDEMKSNLGIPDEKQATGTEKVAVRRPKKRIPTTQKKPSGKVMALEDVFESLSLKGQGFVLKDSCIDGEVEGGKSPCTSRSPSLSKPDYTFKGSCEYSFKIKAKWYQSAILMIDDKRYEMSVGNWANNGTRIVVGGEEADGDDSPCANSTEPICGRP